MLETPEPKVQPAPRVRTFPRRAADYAWDLVVKIARWHRRHWFELILLTFMLGILTFDRGRLCQEYFFKYFDEDQGIEWYAAHETLAGKFHEPCFYGQSYNSNMEGILAAPLVATGLHYKYAVPIVTVFLGVLPFLLVAYAAFRRGQGVVATISLAIPVLLSTRYAMITGMPRGFVTGVALAAIPAVLLLPPLAIHLPEKRRWLKAAPPQRNWFVRMILDALASMQAPRTWPRTRYFFAAFFAVVAVTANPNCAILLAPVAVYGLLTSLFEWRAWLWGLNGLLVASAYPAYVYQFYYKLHTDYNLYPGIAREQGYHWDKELFRGYFYGLPGYPRFDSVIRDLMPPATFKPEHMDDFTSIINWLHVHFPGIVTDFAVRSPAITILCGLFVIVAILLLWRGRIAGAIALVAAGAILIKSLSYSRLLDGSYSVSFPYSRMFLAIPAVFVWGLVLVNARRRRPFVWTRPFTIIGIYALAAAIACWMLLPHYLWIFPLALGILAFAWVGCFLLGWLPAINRFLSRTIDFVMVGFGVAQGRKWIARFAMLWIAFWTATTAQEKSSALSFAVSSELSRPGAAAAVPIAGMERVARVIQSTADKEKIKFVLVLGGNGRKWAYVIPELTTCESLFPNYDRRTWRYVEECEPRYDKIMVVGEFLGNDGRIVSNDPPLSVYDMRGRSVIEFCNNMGLGYRYFETPDGAAQGRGPNGMGPRGRFRW